VICLTTLCVRDLSCLYEVKWGMLSDDVHAGEGEEEACPLQGAVFVEDEGEAAGGAERDLLLLLLCWNLGL